MIIIMGTISKIVLKLHAVKSPSNWLSQFRRLHNTDKYYARNWFWDNFDWNQQSLWIGKFNKMNQLPNKDNQIISFMKKIVDDVNQSDKLKSDIYIKLYYSKNTTTNDPEINYLIICNTPQLPDDFSDTIASIVFERYQLTEKLLTKESDFKNLINHYIQWNNFYTYYDLMGEVQN